MSLGGCWHPAVLYFILVLIFHIFDGLTGKHDNWPFSFTVNLTNRSYLPDDVSPGSTLF